MEENVLERKRLYRVKNDISHWDIIASSLSDAAFKYTFRPISGHEDKIRSIELLNSEVFE